MCFLTLFLLINNVQLARKGICVCFRKGQLHLQRLTHTQNAPSNTHVHTHTYVYTNTQSDNFFLPTSSHQKLWNQVHIPVTFTSISLTSFRAQAKVVKDLITKQTVCTSSHHIPYTSLSLTHAQFTLNIQIIQWPKLTSVQEK